MVEVKWPHEVVAYCLNNICVDYIFISIEKLPVTKITNLTNIIQVGPRKAAPKPSKLKGKDR